MPRDKKDCLCKLERRECPGSVHHTIRMTIFDFTVDPLLPRILVTFDPPGERYSLRKTDQGSVEFRVFSLFFLCLLGDEAMSSCPNCSTDVHSLHVCSGERINAADRAENRIHARALIFRRSPDAELSNVSRPIVSFILILAHSCVGVAVDDWKDRFNFCFHGKGFQTSVSRIV